MDEPPYAVALVVTGMVFLLYAVTLAPTTGFWDASEYIATAHILGIPHPPGNPLFVVLARAWELLLAPLGLTVAVRINLFSAFMSAAAHGFWFLIVHHILRSFTPERGFRVIGAAAAVLVSATAFSVWNQSNVNEKVYTVSLLTIALLTWLAFRWQQNLGGEKNDNLLVLMAFILALSVGNHLMAFLVAPALVVFILVVHPRTVLEWKLYPALLAVGLVGLSIHLVLPLRAALEPVINQAGLTCPSLRSALTGIATYGKAGCQALSEAISREQYLEGASQWWPRRSPLGAQLVNYLQYFDWQWARSIRGDEVVFAWARAPFTLLFTALGVWGAAEHHRRDKPSFYYVLILFFTLSAALVFYLNFLYGYAMPAPGGVLREVRERDYFFIVGFSVWGLWVGIGLAGVWQRLGRRMGGLGPASPVLMLAALPLLLNWGWASRAQDYAPRSWAYDLLMSVEPYGVVITNGDNDTFPLWYMQEVEGVRKDVTVIVGMYLATTWYPKQLQELTTPAKQRPFDAAQSGGIYSSASAPTHSILSGTPEQLDAMGGVRLERDAVVPFPGLAVSYPAGTVLNRVQRMGLQIMHDSIDERPIYFTTPNGLMRELGLDAFAVRQGLVSKLVLRPLDEPQPAGLVRASPAMGAEWFDYMRSLELYNGVYDFRGFRNRKIWSDHANPIPLNFYVMALQLSDVAEKQGSPPSQLRALRSDAEAFRVTAEAWTGGGGR